MTVKQMIEKFDRINSKGTRSEKYARCFNAELTVMEMYSNGFISYNDAEELREKLRCRMEDNR